jgi:Fur family transcriptional regulator, ferric uptake regulator
MTDEITASATPDPMEVLRGYVAKHGLKFTRQRERIAEVFFGAGGHLAVEDLLIRVRKEEPNVSLATVYRTMKLLTECGLASSHRFNDRQTLYEPAENDDHHHDHIICVDCGHILEFFDQRIESLQEQIADKHGFEVRNHRMELYCSCSDPKCSRRN